MEDKMMNMLEQLYIEVKTINKRLDNMDSDMKDLKSDIQALKQGQATAEERLTRIEAKVDTIEAKVDTVEAKVDTIDSKLDTVEAHNASRHVEIRDEIIDIKKNITAVEIVTAKNWNEIATLKAIK